MPNNRTLTVELTETQLADLDAAVDSGKYPTTDAIVQEAVSDWQIRHALNDADIQHLRALWDEGRADGMTRSFDVKCILARARARKTRATTE
jgi:antitoxin ParD1/3/4